jgi:hypothetical protein
VQVSRVASGNPKKAAMEACRVTEDERAELTAVLANLVEEEADQKAARGHASTRLLRATARLDRLLEDGSGRSAT